MRAKAKLADTILDKEREIGRQDEDKELVLVEKELAQEKMEKQVLELVRHFSAEIQAAGL